MRLSLIKSQLFHQAAQSSNLPLVQSLSADHTVDLNWQDLHQRTPFYVACAAGHLPVVRFLLSLPQGKVDVNTAQEFGSSPFLIACLRGHVEVVALLLGDPRVDVNRVDQNERTPLWIASLKGSLAVVKELLMSDRFIDVARRDKWNNLPAAGYPRSFVAYNTPAPNHEEEFLRKRDNYQAIVELLEEYQADPRGVRDRLRREAGYQEKLAGELFALMVYLSDGYFAVTKERKREPAAGARRFFRIAAVLPMDLQMVVSNRTFGLGDVVVRRKDSEHGFRKFESVPLPPPSKSRGRKTWATALIAALSSKN